MPPPPPPPLAEPAGEPSAAAKPTGVAAAARGAAGARSPAGKRRPGVAAGVRARAAAGGACLCGAGGGGFTLCPRPPVLPAGLRSPAAPGLRRSGGRPEEGLGREEKAAAPGRLPLPLRLAPRPESQGGSGRRGGGERRAGRAAAAPPPARPSAPRPGAVCKLRPFCGAESARATLLHHVVGAAAAPLLLLLPLPFLLLLALPVAPISPSLC